MEFYHLSLQDLQVRWNFACLRSLFRTKCRSGDDNWEDCPLMKTVRFGLKFQKKLKTGPFFFLSNLLFQGQDWTVTLNCLFVCFKSFKFVASINCLISAPHCPLEPSIYCHSQSSFISDFFESCTHKTRDCTKGGKGALKLVFQLCKKRKAKALPSVMSIFLKPLYCHYTQVLRNIFGQQHR